MNSSIEFLGHQINDIRDEYFGTDVWLRAPNGAPSSLPEVNWLQTRTPAFKAWAGDWEIGQNSAGCVLDKNGEPMLAYRGESSGELFEGFDLSKTNAGVGFFFAEEIEQARNYAGRGTSPRSFYLRSENTLNLLDPWKPSLRDFLNDYRDHFDEWIDRYSGEKVDPGSLIESGSLYDYEGTGSGTRWNRLFVVANLHGFDAVTVLDVTDGVQAPIWLVYSPEQIRVADGDMQRFAADWEAACRHGTRLRA